MNWCSLKLCNNAALRGVSSHCSNAPRVASSLWSKMASTHTWGGEKERGRETKTIFIFLKKKKYPRSCHSTCLHTAHWLEHMTSTSHTHLEGDLELHPVSWQALGPWREREMGANEEIKMSQSCYCEGENKGNEISKLGKFCPVMLRLSINIKA